MTTYNIKDKSFINSNIYKEFINKNPKVGYLKIRAYSANEAIPITKLNITVSTEFNGDRIIFFEGKTNESGIIENISLPAPTITKDNLVVPHFITYLIDAVLPDSNLHKEYKVNIYEGIEVVQNINATPQINDNGVPLWL